METDGGGGGNVLGQRAGLGRRVLSPGTALLVLIAACNLFLVHAVLVFLLVSPPYSATEVVLLWVSGFSGLMLLVYGSIVGWSTLRRLRETENRLTVVGSRLEAIVEASPTPIAASDRDGLVVLWNSAAERLFGRPRQEVVGRRLARLPDADAEAWERIYDRVRRGHTVTEAEARWTTGDDVPLAVCVSAAPVRNGHGGIDGTVSVITDLSQRRQIEEERARLEEQLHQAQKMEAVGRLAGGVAHDFNNILTAIKGNADLLLTGEVDLTQAREEIEEIRGASVRAAALTRQLLAFSRQGIVRPRPLDLNQLVGDMERLLRRVIGKDVSLETDLAGDLGTVNADPGQIEQVLMNLVVNARDAMPGGGQILIRTSNARLGEAQARQRPFPVVAGDYVVVSVTDTGTGIDPETARRIFEPFFTTKPVGVGTGLGLSTAYGIIKQARGYIWVDSDVGLGSTFLVHLPRVDALPEPVDEPESEGRRGYGGTGTILVVEDEEAVLNLARKVLTASGYHVLTAGLGTHAVRIAREHPDEIHCLFCDAVLPDLAGGEIVSRVTQLRPGIRVVLTSGYARPLIARHGALDDEVSFLPKPYSPADLTNHIRETLGART